MIFLERPTQANEADTSLHAVSEKAPVHSISQPYEMSKIQFSIGDLSNLNKKQGELFVDIGVASIQDRFKQVAQ